MMCTVMDPKPVRRKDLRLLAAPGGELIIYGRLPGTLTFKLVCFGRKRHYRADGTCPHTAALLAAARPFIRRRTTVVGWGGKTYEGVGTRRLS